MSEQPEVKWLDTREVTPRELNTDEVSALIQMFGSQGWKVWQQLRGMECDASALMGLSVSADESTRTMHRALYHSLVSDLTFEQRLLECIRSLDGAETSAPDTAAVSPFPIPKPTGIVQRFRRFLSEL